MGVQLHYRPSSGLDVIPGNVVVVDPRGGEFTPVFDIVSVIDEPVEGIYVQDHRDPTARLGSVVVAVLARTHRGLVSELELTASRDGVPTDCVVNFDNIHTIPRTVFRRRITALSPTRLSRACRTLRDATAC